MTKGKKKDSKEIILHLENSWPNSFLTKLFFFKVHSEQGLAVSFTALIVDISLNMRAEYIGLALKNCK